MVKVKNIVVILAALIIISCGSVRHIDTEDMLLSMVSVVERYTSTYAEPPQCADDLMTFIENGGIEFYQHTLYYRFLKKNRHRLIFQVTDSTISIYNKSVQPDKLELRVGNCASTAYKTVENRISFFDEQGYFYVTTDSVHNVLWHLMSEVAREHINELKQDSTGRYMRIMLEYNQHGLRNLFTDEDIDCKNSDYFNATWICLNQFATENRLSKIIIPSFIDQ